MKIGVPKETAEGERRVALVPDVVKALTAKEIEVAVEPGAGEGASHPDSEYTDAGREGRRRRLERRRRPQGHAADRRGGRPPEAGPDPDRLPRAAHQSRARQVACRGGRHQLRDGGDPADHARPVDGRALLAGQPRRLHVGADRRARVRQALPDDDHGRRDVPPAKVLVLGAGVAGLQAIATAKRLGGVVTGFDVRSVVKEQVAVARRPLPRGRGRQGRRGRGRLRAAAHRRGEREASRASWARPPSART